MQGRGFYAVSVRYFSKSIGVTIQSLPLLVIALRWEIRGDQKEFQRKEAGFDDYLQQGSHEYHQDSMIADTSYDRYHKSWGDIAFCTSLARIICFYRENSEMVDTVTGLNAKHCLETYKSMTTFTTSLCPAAANS